MEHLDKSTKDSSLEMYGYDMVLAVTQESLNSTLKNFLSHLKDEEHILCCVAEKKGKKVIGYKEVDYNVIKKSCKKDLFDIPDDPDKQKAEDIEAMEIAYGLKFVFAFKYQYGFLKKKDSSQKESLKPLIELADSAGKYEKQVVNYNMYFKKFQLISLSYDYGDLCFVNAKQGASPIIFPTKVNLDLDKIKNDDLPKEVKDAIRNMGVNMFSAQQLFLDVNTARLQSMPDIAGVDKKDPMYTYLIREFIPKCWQYMSEKGKIPFHYVVKPTVVYNTPSVVPTDFNFCISPYRPKGRDPKDNSLYTLNYLIMCEGHEMPVIKEFDWNWVEKDENVHGSVAINRNTYTQKIQQKFSECLQYLVKEPDISFITYWDHFEVSAGVTDSFQKLSYVTQNPGIWQATHSVSKKKEGHVGPADAYAGELNATYTLNSRVELVGDRIKHQVEVTYYLSVFRKGCGTAKGNIYHLAHQAEYSLRVEEHGEMRLDLVSHSELPSYNFEADGWFKFNTFGSVNSFCEDLKNQFKNYLAYYTGNINTKLLKSLNRLGYLWIFPGNETFLMKDVLFSGSSKDLTAHLTYKKP